MHTPQASAGAGVATIKQAPIPPVQAAGRASHRLSPSDGTVMTRQPKPSRSVSAGRSRPMLSLGHNTVRTIVGKVSGTDRPTIKHLQRIDPDRARMRTWTAKRQARHAAAALMRQFRTGELPRARGPAARPLVMLWTKSSPTAEFSFVELSGVFVCGALAFRMNLALRQDRLDRAHNLESARAEAGSGPHPLSRRAGVRSRMRMGQRRGAP
jgi:hypothetical protein